MVGLVGCQLANVESVQLKLTGMFVEANSAAADIEERWFEVNYIRDSEMIAIDNDSIRVFASQNGPRRRPRFRACQAITIRVQSRLPGGIDRGTPATSL